MAPRLLACVRCGFFKEASQAPADKIEPHPMFLGDRKSTRLNSSHQI